MKLQESTELMPKESGITKHDWEMFSMLGGRKIPADLTAKAEAAMKATMLKKRDPRIELQMQAAKLYGALKGGSPIAVDDPANRQTLDAILQLHRRAASADV